MNYENFHALLDEAKAISGRGGRDRVDRATRQRCRNRHLNPKEPDSIQQTSPPTSSNARSPMESSPRPVRYWPRSVARHRLASGTFGRCEPSGQTIDVERLPRCLGLDVPRRTSKLTRLNCEGMNFTPTQHRRCPKNQSPMTRRRTARGTRRTISRSPQPKSPRSIQLCQRCDGVPYCCTPCPADH